MLQTTGSPVGSGKIQNSLKDPGFLATSFCRWFRSQELDYQIQPSKALYCIAQIGGTGGSQTCYVFFRCGIEQGKPEKMFMQSCWTNKCNWLVTGQVRFQGYVSACWFFELLDLHMFYDQSSQKLGWKHQFFDSFSHLERVLSDKAWRGTLVSYI